MSTVGTSPETAIGSLPPNPDAAKDREKWRKITPPERKKRPPEQGQIPEGTETQTQSRPALGEPLPSSGDMSRQLRDNTKEASEAANSREQTGTTEPQRTPSRGIWGWARAGTGRLNIIGRIPHPEWKGPAVANRQDAAINGASNGDTINKAHDDFSIPSTTATEPDNVERRQVTDTAKIEGLGIENVISPSFAQTKRSSDELVATASSMGTPDSRGLGDEPWTNGETTPSAASRDSAPSTPDTPTPQQRRKESPDRPQGQKTDNHESPTRKPRREDIVSESENASTPKKASAKSNDMVASRDSAVSEDKDTSNSNDTSHSKHTATTNDKATSNEAATTNGAASSKALSTSEEPAESQGTSAKNGTPAKKNDASSQDTPSKKNDASSQATPADKDSATSPSTPAKRGDDTPASNKSKLHKHSPNPDRIAKYKIALARNLLPPARNGTATT
jgi:hypothetical protein